MLVAWDVRMGLVLTAREMMDKTGADSKRDEDRIDKNGAEEEVEKNRLEGMRGGDRDVSSDERI